MEKKAKGVEVFFLLKRLKDDDKDAPLVVVRQKHD
jgi:hypothetical protein